MRRFCLILILMVITGSCCFADDWDDYMKIDEAAKSQQKTVTQDEFEKVMQRFEKKKKTKPAVKGESRMFDNENPDSLKIMQEMYETYPTIMVPTDLISIDGQEIPTGFYRIMSVKKPYGYYMNFYQGNSLIARVHANPTNNDYNQKTLNYAKMISHDDKSVKFIYGDIDCNLETLINIKKQQEQI